MPLLCLHTPPPRRAAFCCIFFQLVTGFLSHCAIFGSTFRYTLSEAAFLQQSSQATTAASVDLYLGVPNPPKPWGFLRVWFIFKEGSIVGFTSDFLIKNDSSENTALLHSIIVYFFLLHYIYVYIYRNQYTAATALIIIIYII